MSTLNLSKLQRHAFERLLPPSYSVGNFVGQGGSGVVYDVLINGNPSKYVVKYFCCREYHLQDFRKYYNASCTIPTSYFNSISCNEYVIDPPPYRRYHAVLRPILGDFCTPINHIVCVVMLKADCLNLVSVSSYILSAIVDVADELSTSTFTPDELQACASFDKLILLIYRRCSTQTERDYVTLYARAAKELGNFINDFYPMNVGYIGNELYLIDGMAI